MNDRSIYYGRKAKKEKEPQILGENDIIRVLSDESISQRRHLCLLAHLCRVILQDAAVILLTSNSAAKHPIFKRDVFRSSQFLSFKQKIAEALTNASIGFANLATVTPTIQQHIAAVNTAVSAINSQQQALSAQLTQYSEQLTNSDGQDQRVQQRNQLVNERILQNTTTVNDKLTVLIDCVTIALTDALTTLNRIQSPIDANTIQIAEPRLNTLPAPEVESVQQGLGNSTMVDSKSCSNCALAALADACRLFVTDETLQQQRQSNLLSPMEISPLSVQRSDDDNSTITSEAKAHAVEVIIIAERRLRGNPEHRMPRSMPLCTLVPRSNTLEGVWKEWFYGVNGTPSIMEMNKCFMLRRLLNTKMIEKYTNLTVTVRPSVCPLSHGATVCIRPEASKAAFIDICGEFQASVSSCQDKNYGTIITTKDHIEDVSEHTLRIVVQGEGVELGEAIDNFVQKRSRWMVDITQGNGYELLTTFDDPRRLAYMSQLDLIQYQCTNFFRGGINGNGFGSRWHTVSLGLSFGLYYNMTYLTPEVLNNFIPLTSCTEADMKRAFNKNPPEHEWANWTKSTTNFQMSNDGILDMAALAKVVTKAPGFEDKDLFWLRSMVAYYAVRPNYLFRNQFQQHSPIQTPCMSIHVRHADKRFEAKLLEFPDYMEKAEEYRRNTGVSNIYLMSDDGNVIKSTEDYKDFQFQYLDTPRQNEAWYTIKAQGVPMGILERNFLMEIMAAAQCEHQILTYSSNVGRLIGELAYALRNKEPSVVSLDQGWWMWP
ncbi:hypothetical protein FBU30_001279 [Linnemannia zychae]|nr:hypothetical protein FBU30_001279 [Linnemannia zychae]